MKIKILFLLGLLTIAVGGCSTRDYSSNDFKHLTAKQILQNGQKAMAKRDYSQAAKYFEAIDALYPFDPEVRTSQLEVIYAYYKTEDYASALAASTRYIHLYPEESHTDYAYYMKGIVNFYKNRTPLQRLFPKRIEELDISNLNDAFINFGELLKRYPNSIYAKDAEKRMLYIRNLLAKHELEIAKFYLKRKAYVGAANRASGIVKHFEGAPQVKDALKIMFKSYRSLGLEKQASDAKRIFELNFPREKIT